MSQLIALFRAEHDRYRELLRRLREAFSMLPEIRTAWIDELPLDVGQPLHIGVVADSASLTYLGEEIRQRIVNLERDYDLTMEVHTFSRADAPEVHWPGTTLLSGEPTSDEISNTEVSTHSDGAARAVVMSKAVAELLDRDPTLLRRAQRHLEDLLEQSQGMAAHDLREWQEILEHYSRERIREFLVADTPRAQRLRQSSPFFAVLTAEERDEVLDQVAQRDA